ncbi:hypothetical protein [Nocardioides currus]|uniref:Uncharacterized protein n=1 Tax=Nocardioides currus TaxID=2133958 RepID=A0A2R7YX14_9ACTN|nr:hypothetical protein [Nocardioides currus]PUA80925.1 hypothetical protein C7S10_11020 [Nocardioides currus]
MTPRRAFATLALLLAPSACTLQTTADDRSAAPTCDGVSYTDVRGPEPGEPNGSLRDHPVADAVCQAWWLDLADGFVPQGLAIEGRRAFVVGHRAGAVGSKLCQVAVIDLPSGRTNAFTGTLDARDGSPTCRHGGGAALTDAGLWVVQTSRLWLLDPDRIGRPDQVRRVWDLADEVRGSTIAAHDGEIVIAGYRPNGPGQARSYAEASVLASGATELVETATGRGQVAMTGASRVPPRLQGLAFSPAGRAWHVSSRISCGRIHAGSRIRDFVPGAEGTVVTRDSIWTVSEASAAPYRDPGGALVPRLLRLDRDRVLDAGPATCVF